MNPATLVSLSFAVVLWGMVGGQQTDAVCMTTFGWLNNSQGQSPCFVATNLIAECDPYRGNVSALHPGGLGYYPGPDPAINFFPTNCTCNTVTYSLLSACSLCQGFTYIEWRRWAEKCPSVYITEYPEPIPDIVSVPAWAYLNVAVSNNFSAAEAASDKNPDITAGSPTDPAIPAWPNATLAPSPTPSYFPVPSSSPVPSSPTTPSFSTARARSFDMNSLIGIVIGGVLVMAMVLGVAEGFHFHWKRRKAARSVENSEGDTEAQAGARSGANDEGNAAAQVGMVSAVGDPMSSVSVHHMPRPFMPSIPEGDSSEIQLVPRDYNDPGPSIQTSQRSRRVAFLVPDEQPEAGPSRIRLDS